MNYCTASVYILYKRIFVKRIGYLEEEGGVEKKRRKLSGWGVAGHPVGKTSRPLLCLSPEMPAEGLGLLGSSTHGSRFVHFVK